MSAPQNDGSQVTMPRVGGVLQTSNIHILTCDAGRVTQTLRVGGQRS
jgi:hypothetical protein